MIIRGFWLILLLYLRLIKDVSRSHGLGFVDLIWVLVLIFISRGFIFCLCCLFDIWFKVCLCELGNCFPGHVKRHLGFWLFDVEVSQNTPSLIEGRRGSSETLCRHCNQNMVNYIYVTLIQTCQRLSEAALSNFKNIG